MLTYAQMDSAAFRASFAADAVSHLIATLKKDIRERDVTFISLSQVLYFTCLTGTKVQILSSST
jgi:hypothetical protein